jgi:hypothetical protein
MTNMFQHAQSYAKATECCELLEGARGLSYGFKNTRMSHAMDTQQDAQDALYELVRGSVSHPLLVAQFIFPIHGFKMPHADMKLAQKGIQQLLICGDLQFLHVEG